MRLQKTLFSLLLLLGFFIFSTSVQEQYLIDNDAFYSIRDQQEIQRYLTKRNDEQACKIYLICASQQQINGAPGKYVNARFTPLNGTEVIVYLA